jgi:hypothetical protein
VAQLNGGRLRTEKATQLHIKTINGREYAYKSIRHGDKVTSECCGSSALGSVFIAMDIKEREEQQAKREEDRQQIEAIAKADKRLRETDQAVAAAVSLMIEAMGFYRHYRGPWRRRAMTATLEPKTTPLAKPFDVEGFIRRANASEAGALEEWSKIVEKGRKGDKEALDKFREISRRDPAMNARTVEYLLTHSRDKILGAMFADNHLTRIVMEAHLERMAKDLAGPNPSMVERMLSDRAALCWLQVYRDDYEETVNRGVVSIALGRFQVLRQSQSHKRLLSALKALADVRKISLVALQVNLNSADK